ncbi:thioredoxin [Reyranella sp. CPCC 100927]|uniref:thioredoxin n=1 Tax=Reyranella sp. CPCC 100927 TaxID=2599616 RepID=UPI0011B53D72|nr:thioredoxin [Reyranella sp. CPCC 100927]TWS95923.1 thioredoxin [Reyranella sp. CPCC 100927]
MDQIIGGGAPADADLVKDSDQKRFAKDVLEASRTRPVIVDFWAPWCGPCKTLGPIIEKAVKNAKGAVQLIKINIDENQMLAQQLRIQSIPTVYAFFQGRPVDGFQGALPEGQIKQFIDRLVQATGGTPGGDQLAELLEHAKAALEGGDVSLAARVYGEILQQEPENPTAVAGMAKCYLASGDAERAKALLASLPPAVANNAEIAAVRSAIELAEQAEQAGPVGELEAKVAANPKDHEARLELATALYAADNKEAAVDHLLQSIKIDRKWNEEAARKQLLKYFEALGFNDPISVDGRKRLSSILFS